MASQTLDAGAEKIESIARRQDDRRAQPRLCEVGGRRLRHRRRLAAAQQNAAHVGDARRGSVEPARLPSRAADRQRRADIAAFGEQRAPVRLEARGDALGAQERVFVGVEGVGGARRRAQRGRRAQKAPVGRQLRETAHNRRRRRRPARRRRRATSWPKSGARASPARFPRRPRPAPRIRNVGDGVAGRPGASNAGSNGRSRARRQDSYWRSGVGPSARRACMRAKRSQPRHWPQTYFAARPTPAGPK